MCVQSHAGFPVRDSFSRSTSEVHNHGGKDE
jgi:hypothetical protein